MNPNEITKDTIFPSAKALLDAGFSCREVCPNRTRINRWSAYWMEGGAELTLFPGGEGPQEMYDVEDLIDSIGGDQPATLTPATIKYRLPQCQEELENLLNG